MWGRKQPAGDEAMPPERPEEPARAPRLTEAIRRARLENAERSSVVVDLRDAELTRLELLDEALAPLFSEVPKNIDIFDRAISKGETPRLWIDSVAHVVMGRDKRVYRFVQDTRFGRKILAESHDAAEIVEAVTRYVARRMIERERALAEEPMPGAGPVRAAPPRRRRRSFWRIVGRIVRWLLVLFVLFWVAVWYLATH